MLSRRVLALSMAVAMLSACSPADPFEGLSETTGPVVPSPYVEPTDEETSLEEPESDPVGDLVAEVAEEAGVPFTSGPFRPSFVFPESARAAQVSPCPAGLSAVIVMVESASPVSMTQQSAELPFGGGTRELTGQNGQLFLAHVAVFDEPIYGPFSISLPPGDSSDWAYIPFCLLGEGLLDVQVNGSDAFLSGDLTGEVAGTLFYSTVDMRDEVLEVPFRGELPLELPLQVEGPEYVFELRVVLDAPFDFVYLLY